MHLTLDKLFDNAYAINTDPEYLKHMRKIFDYHFLPMPNICDNFQLKTAKTQTMSVSDCNLFHLDLIKTAKASDLPFICIFEDTAYPCYDVKEKLQYYLTDIPDNCEYMALGNINVKYKGKCADDKFMRVDKVHGKHAYIVFKSGYDKLISNYSHSADNDNVLSGINAYSPKNNLFIQYCKVPDMFMQYYQFGDNMRNYMLLWQNVAEKQIFEEFPKIEAVLCDQPRQETENIVLSSQACSDQKTFIKLIITEYNAEKTLPKMLDSILNQTFQDFKVIIVDDASTDNTWNIIEDYQRKHSEKIIAIKSAKRLYCGSMRNIGIAYPLESTYTWFVDGDDWLNGNDVFQIIYNAWKNTDADVFGIDCDTKTYQEWSAPWWRILKSEFVCEFQPGIKFATDVANLYLVLDKIEGKKFIHIQDKPLYCYSGSHNKNKIILMHEIYKWLSSHEIKSENVKRKINKRFNSVLNQN